MFTQHKNAPAWGTIKNIPIPVSPILKCEASPSTEHSEKYSTSSDTQELPPYVIILEYGNTANKLYDNLIHDSQDDTPPSKSLRNDSALEGIPHFLCHDFKVTMDHKGEFHKG